MVFCQGVGRTGQEDGFQTFGSQQVDASRLCTRPDVLSVCEQAVYRTAVERLLRLCIALPDVFEGLCFAVEYIQSVEGGYNQSTAFGYLHVGDICLAQHAGPVVRVAVARLLESL